MRYGNYEFRCRFESEAQLPVYKGSTFRGVFGRALKQVVCALKRQECPDCLLKPQCLYPMVFEPALLTGRLSASAGVSSPNPYVVEPPLTEETYYPAGAGFNFNLILLGPVNTRLPYFVYAISAMGQIGIGKKIAGKRGRFVIEQVLSEGRVIYTDRDRTLAGFDSGTELTLSVSEMLPVRKDQATLRVMTPLRLKYDNHLSPELPFHILVRAMLRRCASLLSHFGDGEPDLDYRGMVQRAAEVETAHSDLFWEDWRRYSLRQDQAMMMGGLKGSITYAGDLGEFFPLLDFCARVHLGKQTAFGLGRFTWEIES
ncbi:MAG: CRISPR system precrRNA processing endoribonuclease RAMP protein Cas6 [Pseudomonadota bacterium]